MSPKDKPTRKKKRSSSQPPRSAITPKPGSTISRYVSFVMLLVTILVFCFFFYNVIKGFLLPLFLAALLVVIFRPLHGFLQKQVGEERKTLTAALSTSLIMLIVLVPLTGLVFLGLHEANQVIRMREQYIEKAEEVRKSLGLQKPFSEPLQYIEADLRQIDEALLESVDADASELGQKSQEWAAEIQNHVTLLRGAVRDALIALRSDLERDKESTDQALVERVDAIKSQLDEQLGPPKLGPQFADINRDMEKRSLRYLVAVESPDSENGLLDLIDSFSATVDSLRGGPEDTKPSISYRRMTQTLQDLQVAYSELRTALLGGPIWSMAIEIANPSKDQIRDWLSQLTGKATRWLPSITNTATSLITGLLVGLCIMAIALFYFFLDGASMVNTFMRLSPLDDRHELELLEEFDRVSRAVVLATLLSALAQGFLGWIGYKIAGLDSALLLGLLTAVLALIPFVGAAAIWVPACIYLALVKEPVDPETTRNWMYIKAGILATYGVLIISMADNVIKPWVLQGQSKLHPLLALLSVLGGVQALGPIGILVGPMVVAFLQVLLTILQREIQSLEAAADTTG